jgi:hypothetical protein
MSEDPDRMPEEDPGKAPEEEQDRIPGEGRSGIQTKRPKEAESKGLFPQKKADDRMQRKRQKAR